MIFLRSNYIQLINMHVPICSSTLVLYCLFLKISTLMQISFLSPIWKNYDFFQSLDHRKRSILITTVISCSWSIVKKNSNNNLNYWSSGLVLTFSVYLNTALQSTYLHIPCIQTINKYAVVKIKRNITKHQYYGMNN